MATVTKLGPADHGRPMTFEEFQAGDYTIHWLEKFVAGG